MSPVNHQAEEPTHRLSPVLIKSAADVADAPADPPTTPRTKQSQTQNRAGGLPTVRGYELLSELGRGGMGVVYLGVQRHLRRSVAVKMLPSDRTADPLDVARFFSEAEAVAAVKHPHVVQIYEFALHNSQPFMVMEYLPGGSLSAKLRHQTQRMTSDEGATLLEKLARAVQAAHEQGIVHRDLKPGNVLFDEAGEPRVTDFGLAKRATSHLTQTMEISGTPAYMAPEQASGRTKYAGPAADIYALGAILYECLTGSVPFEQVGTDPWPVLNRVIHEPPTRPGRLAPVPIDLELICLKCLEKSPRDRYATAAALADDLSRFLNRRAVSVRPPGVLERGVKWARRRPTAATAYALAAVVFGMSVVGAVVVTFWLQALESKRRTEAANLDIQEQMELTAEARNAALQREGETQQARRLVEVQKGQVEKALLGETTAKQSLLKTQQDLLKVKYYHDVSLAHSECAEGNIGRADYLLALCPKELRGWEWWHCRAVAHPELASFTIPDCLDLTFTPNGERLVACNTNSQMEHRDPNSGAVLKKVTVPSRATLRRWLSADGERLLIVALDEKYDFEPPPEDRSKVCVAAVWDTAAGKRLVDWKDLSGSFPECSVSADGSIGVITGDQESARARSYDLKTGKLIAELPDRISSPYSSITADGKFALSVAMDAERYVFITLWETKTGKVVQRFQYVHNRSHVSMLQPRISPDGTHLVFVSATGDLGFWKVGQPAPFRYLTGVHTGTDFRLAFSADGSLCATAGGEGGIRLWKTSTGEALGVFHGHRAKVNKLAFHPRQARLLSVDTDGHAKLWRIAGGSAVSQFDIPGPWRGPVAVNDRADRMFMSNIFPDNEHSLLFHRDGPKQVRIPYQHSTDYVFLPGGNLLALLNVTAQAQTLEFWDAATAKEVRKVSLPGGMPGRLAVSADGTRVVAALGTGSVRVWDAATGKEVFNVDWHPSVGVGALSGDGKRVAWGSVVGFAAIYDVASGDKLCTVRLPDNEVVTALALGTDGAQVAIGTKNRTIYLFDVPAAGAPEVVPLKASAALHHAAPISALTYSPKSDRLASASDDGCVKMWDPHARLEIVTLKTPHREPVKRLLFSADGNRLIAVGQLNGATIFDGTPGP